MKQSHFVTPRTLADCYFDPRGQAIFMPEKSNKSLIQWIVGLFTGR